MREVKVKQSEGSKAFIFSSCHTHKGGLFYHYKRGCFSGKWLSEKKCANDLTTQKMELHA